MTVTNTITTNFIDESGADLGSQLIEKSHLIDIYPNLNPSLITPTLWAVGDDSAVAGILGNNTSGTVISSPVQTVAYGANWKSISLTKKNTGSSVGTKNANHAVALKNDGTLWTWGGNAYGSLGDNTIVGKSSPIQTVAGGTNWRQASSNTHSAAIKTDGTLWLWGNNSFGQLGDNTTVNKSSPVQAITFGTNWKQISCGHYNTSAGIKNDGTLWTWGNNSFGQLGDNTGGPFSPAPKSSPVQTVAGGTNWKYVEAGPFMAALKTDGSLWLWGNNDRGQLGDNTIISKSSPIQTVTGGTNWKQISVGPYYICGGIKTDATLWMWGGNDNTITAPGVLGDNTTINRSSPVQTVAGGTNWQQISVGSISTCALKTDGSVWSWGYNAGQLGDNTAITRSSPVQILGAEKTWKFVASGYVETMLIKDYNF
jgi:alpha-tubulin suppressor-like RCC1 family protein